MGIAFSKLTTKSQTVIPREVRERLGLKPGDRVRYSYSASGVTIEKAGHGAEDDPFAVFTEWSGAADEEAYGRL
ncbi:MAG: AbrB family transcriptional regulator [Rhizobiales bacterium]|nr:AbrB family transcriptional regulator [Hyphomicrobiales bacterium]